MRIWWSFSQPSERSTELRFSTNLTAVLVVLVLSSLILLIMPQQRLVSLLHRLAVDYHAHSLLEKFTGYQYGGRPLGLTFVKYMNPNNGDTMEETEGAGGMTQDQIM